MSSAKIGTSSWRYYTAGVACQASEYYAGVGEAPGRWHGRGLAQLGLESGAVVRGPLFVNEGDVVRVDTRSGEYVSRV